MKKIFLIVFLLSTILGWTQVKSELFQSEKIIFYGLDFTYAKFVVHKKIPDSTELVHRYFSEWNYMYLDERDGFDMRRPLKKKLVLYDTVTYSINAQINPDDVMVNEATNLELKQIRKYIKNYSDFSKEGYGMVYMVESLNAKDKYLSAWLTFFDLKTGELLFSEPIRVKAKGRNFTLLWASAFDELYLESKNSYRVWYKMYK
jgi:hypothetical protein